MAIWYTVTPTGKNALKNYAADQSNPEEVRQYANELLSRKGSGIASLGFSSAQSMREERRKIMQRPISDEALTEFDELTSKLLAKQ